MSFMFIRDILTHNWVVSVDRTMYWYIQQEYKQHVLPTWSTVSLCIVADSTVKKCLQSVSSHSLHWCV